MIKHKTLKPNYLQVFNFTISTLSSLKISESSGSTNLFFSFPFPKNENRALRLRESATLSHLPTANKSDSVPPNSNNFGAIATYSASDIVVPQLSWNYFDEQAYIHSRSQRRRGEDPYIRNRFNQQASDALPSNRDIPDTRNLM